MLAESSRSERVARDWWQRWMQPTAAVREHLVLIVTLVASVVAAVAAVSYALITQAETRALALYEQRVLPASALRSISDGYAIDVVDTVHKVSAQRLDIAEGARRVDRAIAVSDAAFRSLQARRIGPRQLEPLFARARTAAEQARDLMLTADLAGLEAFRTRRMYTLVEPLTEALGRAVQDEIRQTDSLVRETRSQLRGLRFGATLSLLCVSALGWAYVASFSRSLSRSIACIEHVVRTVANGDLSVRAGGKVDPAFAVMASDIDSMIEALQRSHAELTARGAELEQAAEQARGANAAKSMFLSGMSHELRTPLNVILGYAQVLAREPQRSESDRQTLHRVMQAGAHLLGLIEDVLSISKIEAGQLALRPHAFESAALVETLQGMFADRAQRKGLQLRVDADASLPPWLHADAGRVRQVLVNLIGNALKFTEHGEVCVKLWYTPGRLHASVSDTGPGMSPDELSGLFQRFFQGKAGQHTSEGAGLGLYISRSLVRLMGGEVQATSRLGAGSVFTFDVEAEAASPRALTPHRPQVLAAGSVCDPMLVADDREDNREVLSRLLRQLGFAVEEVCDGPAAIDACARASYSIVWMDLRMPGMNGEVAMRRIREADALAGRPRRKIVAITASVIDIDRESARDRGFDELVGKPFNDAEVTELIAAMLSVRFEECARARATEEPQAADDVAPSLDGLQQLPHALRSSLLSALIAGDAALARGVISQVSAQPLARALHDLVDRYAYDGLIAELRAIHASTQLDTAGEHS